MKNVEVKKEKEQTLLSKVNFCTEMAFGTLLDQAKRLGIPLQVVDGLMYLPNLDTTKHFQQACRQVISGLIPKEQRDEMKDQYKKLILKGENQNTELGNQQESTDDPAVK